MPQREQQLVQQIKDLHPDCKHILWTDTDSEMPDALKHWYNKNYTQEDFAFCADILRLWYVYKYGGFYLDVDWDIKTPFYNLFENSGVFFYHDGNDFTMPNGIFGACKESEILKFCIDTTTTEYGWFGPSWLGETVKKFLKLKNEIEHETVKKALRDINYDYHLFHEFEKTYGKHMSLYSWSPENKKLLAGNLC